MEAARLSFPVVALCLLAIGALSSAEDPMVIDAAPTPQPPIFDKPYSISGRIWIPYAEISEPFQAWYEPLKNRSRIDYYGGTVKTYQLASKGQFGTSLKVAPMTTEEALNVKTCFLVNGTQNATVTIQPIIPDLKGFMFIGVYNISGVPCNTFYLRTSYGDIYSTYLMWISKETNMPVLYEMNGYNSLLSSHYDKYYVLYTNYQNVTQFNDSIFNVSDIKCRSFPGPGTKEYGATDNPMMEFINGEDSHIDDSFEDFKDKHNKEYEHEQEQAHRKNNFRHNFRFISSMNRAGHSYSLAVNHLADWNANELNKLRGRQQSEVDYNGGLPFHLEKYDISDMPDTLDWRLFGAVTPVKDQAICGSCWSFGTAGTIEGAYFLKTNKIMPLSEQALIDCSWGFLNNGCDGGEDFRAYAWIKKHGLPFTEFYGPYLGQDGYCHEKNIAANRRVHINDFVNITARSPMALKVAIFKEGPISVSIDASPKGFLFYSRGVFYDPKCKTGEKDLDHTVLAVGYGVQDGQAYWLIKNSWSTYWGNDGYFLMQQLENDCGVTTSATHVVL